MHDQLLIRPFEWLALAARGDGMSLLWVVLLLVLVWSALSVMLVGGLGLWVALARSRRAKAEPQAISLARWSGEHNMNGTTPALALHGHAPQARNPR
jgi:hypothetical protein